MSVTSLPADGTQSKLRVTVTQGGSPHLRYVRIDNNVNGSYAGHVRRPMMTSGHSLTPGGKLEKDASFGFHVLAQRKFP